MSEAEDPALLDRASELGRVLFTNDDDLLVEATRRQRTGEYFYSVVYARQQRVPVGDCVRDLELIAKAGGSEDAVGRILFLPM
jgi:hypothetical protein